MKTFIFWIRYDGTAFHGWQRQASDRTVQSELEAALGIMLGDNFKLGTSSRTDAGVHAWQHPVSVSTTADIPPIGMRRGLNSLLPDDVTVIDIQPVSTGFQSRKGSMGKTYVYRIQDGEVPDPLEARYAWHIKHRLDAGAMKAGAEHFLGTHDFAAFRSAQCDSITTTRLIFAAHVERRGRLITVTISGNAFMRTMVRVMVGTLVEVGSGRRPPAWIAEVIAGGDRHLAGVTAPARGLALLDVAYPTELFADGAHGF